MLHIVYNTILINLKKTDSEGENIMLQLKWPSSQRCLLVSLSILFFLTVAQAAEAKHPIDKTTAACQVKNYTTVGMQNCLAIATEQWDKELNKNFNALMKKIDQPCQEALKKSQKQWLTYRDGEFKTIETIYGALEGTMWGIIAANAKVEIVKHRGLELKEYLNSLAQEK
jgi:uncharacterized protein YecT (DUF1311 family)